MNPYDPAENPQLFQQANIRQTQQNYFSELTVEDIGFYEQVKSLVTASHALPFNIPVDTFFHIVGQSMKFFWCWYQGATEELSYFAPWHEIQKFKRGTGYGLRLPFNVENVFGWHLTRQAFNPALANFLRWNYIQTYSSSSAIGGIGGGGAGGFRSSYKNQPAQLSNMVIQLYEFESYTEMFGRVVAASFNNNTSILNVRGSIDPGCGLVIDIFERCAPEALYDDPTFKEYVVACVEEQLGKIVSAFDFPLIGDVKINYDEIKSRGVEKKEAIETELKEVGGNHDMILFKK